MAHAQAMIRLVGISRTFVVGDEPVHALVDVHEEIRGGEHVAIMGPSGSGKSTLLNILGCLDRPTSGSYWLGEHEVGHLDDAELTQVRRHQIGFVFQFFHLVHRLTAVGLTGRARHKPDQLSGGERQRVALARATVMRPRILLADEPTGNLDRKSGGAVLDVLDRMNDDGLTLVVVTHDPEVARRAERVLVLLDGRVEKRLAPTEIGNIVSLVAEGEPS